MLSYNKLNNIFGWLTFAVACIVYFSTIEPTTSFWDCGEFIATAYKLEVGHPPGAPLFMLIARVVSMFPPPEYAALMVNGLSALCSALAVLFLFWTTTLFAKKIADKNGEMTKNKMIAIFGSGMIAGLSYTFSDTAWFSAVEGEVYSMSSLFTAIAFYAMLKWETVADESHSKKWIILIAFFIGLSIGVHLLSLLTIPALTFIYYFKRYEVTPKGLVKATGVAVLLLGLVQYAIIPGVVSLATKFELIFVNGMGMPFNSGTIIYALVLIGLITYGLWWSYKNDKVTLNTGILAFAVMLIGYSSYSVIAIRSAANTPMDENNPENVFALLSYLNREQYGEKPFLTGQYFNTPLDLKEPYQDGKPVYYPDKDKGEYIVVDDKKGSVPNYDSKFTTFFPRMWSPQKKHIKYYKKWTDFKGTPVRTRDAQGNPKTIYKPKFFSENLKFFFKYQVGWMWGRYFMWNFAGRQNDVQGHGGILNGNWISGIPFIDSIRLGNQSKLPMTMTENKAHNKFYMLPLLLGLLGAWFQYKSDRNNAVIVTLLFFFTGIAILVFLNNYPLEPRERDYAVVGSFYTFCIWIGLGVYGLYDLLKDRMPSNISAPVAVAASFLLVPTLMAAEGWDDHTRAKRFTGRDYAKNYLDSCKPNAILFTNGDNDTFPLWYVQEVEEYRTDVRVVNLSLANTDWYIEQMKRKAYDSDPIPSSIPDNKYRQGTNDYLPLVERRKEATVGQVVDFVLSDHPDSKIQVSTGKFIDFIPTKNLKLKVNKADVIRKGVVKEKDSALIVSEVRWKIKKNYILKNDLMILDILATNNWERPVYFASTAPSESYLGLQNYFQVEGMAYRLVPIKTTSNTGQPGRVDEDILYDNVMNKFVWGGLDENKVYMDENNRRMTISLRLVFSRLAETLTLKGDKERAKEVLDRCMEVIPEENVPFDMFTMYLAENYYMIDEPEKANYIVAALADIYESNLDYFNSLDQRDMKLVENERNQTMAILQRLWYVTTQQYPQEELGKDLNDRFGVYFQNNQPRSPQNQ